VDKNKENQKAGDVALPAEFRNATKIKTNGEKENVWNDTCRGIILKSI
jgi:hypothetical protein